MRNDDDILLLTCVCVCTGAVNVVWDVTNSCMDMTAFPDDKDAKILLFCRTGRRGGVYMCTCMCGVYMCTCMCVCVCVCVSVCICYSVLYRLFNFVCNSIVMRC